MFDKFLIDPAPFISVVFGSRTMGAGFDGHTINIVKYTKVKSLLEAI